MEINGNPYSLVFPKRIPEDIPEKENVSRETFKTFFGFFLFFDTFYIAGKERLVYNQK